MNAERGGGRPASPRAGSNLKEDKCSSQRRG